MTTMRESTLSVLDLTPCWVLCSDGVAVYRLPSVKVQGCMGRALNDGVDGVCLRTLIQRSDVREGGTGLRLLWDRPCSLVCPACGLLVIPGGLPIGGPPLMMVRKLWSDFGAASIASLMAGCTGGWLGNPFSSCIVQYHASISPSSGLGFIPSVRASSQLRCWNLASSALLRGINQAAAGNVPKSLSKLTGIYLSLSCMRTPEHDLGWMI